MSLKKTWFSYVLWFIFAAATALVAYSVFDEVLQEFYSVFYFDTPAFDLYSDIALKVITIVLIVVAVILVRFVCSKVKMQILPKGIAIFVHIFACLGIIAGFCVLRYPAFNYAYYLQTYSRAPAEQAMFFYELSKVGSAMGSGIGAGGVSLLEQVYIYVMHTIFLFFGNKMECLLLTQLILQAVTLVLLMLIGWILQKGIFVWIPALLYAVLPTFFYTAEDAGITNFWTSIVVLLVFVICLFEKVWKKNNITYMVIVFAQLLFGGFVFISKMDVLLFAGTPFVSRGTTPGAISILNVEMLVLVVFLIAYCVSFFMDRQDHRSLFILPFWGFGFLFVWLSNFEYESSYCLMLLTLVNLLFMISQSMRVIFRVNPEVVTGKKIHASFEWEEMKEVMHSTEGIEVMKEEPAKVELSFAEVPVEEKKVVEETEVPISIDRKAPIENVLPMPKKHKPRVLDYAFEPMEDMMHYDVEIENDEYDY